ncbi:beta-tubulin, partial [Naegleria gruberi]
VSDGVLAPYNSILQLQNLVEFVDYVKFYDNEAVYNICRNKIELEKANLEDVNKVIAQSLCAETCSFRFNGFVNNDMRKLATNMIPFPRIHFLVSSMAPLGKQIKGMDNTDIQLTDIVRQLLVPSHFLASLNPKEGRYYTCSATFRGDFTTSNAENELFRTCIYQSSYFHEWIPNNFQSSYCKVAQQGFKRSGSLLASSSAMSNYLKFTSEEFSKLFRRKAFVNWYLAEGMDEMEFTEAESNVNDVISEYIPYYSYYNDTDEEEGPQPDEMSY